MPASIETDWNAAKPQILNEKDTGNHLSLQKPSVKIDKFGAEIIQINSEAVGSRSVSLNNHDIVEINTLKVEYYLAV